MVGTACVEVPASRVCTKTTRKVTMTQKRWTNMSESLGVVVVGGVCVRRAAHAGDGRAWATTSHCPNSAGDAGSLGEGLCVLAAGHPRWRGAAGAWGDNRL